MQKNKLLLTTALAGSLLVSASAYAEISGNIETVFAFGSDERAGAGKDGSDERIGSEMNIVMKSKSDLDNGAYYSYSGKLEVDDASGSAPDHEYEVRYGVGNFYIGAGKDSGAANAAATILPLVAGEYPGTAVAQVGTGASDFVDLMTDSPASGGKEAGNYTHISANMNVAGGVVGVTYAPSTGTQDDDTDNVDDATGGSTTSFVYKGTPMDGLNLILARNVQKGDTDTTAGNEYTNDKIGVSYTFGQITAAVERQTYENDTKSVESKGTAYELAYAIDDKTTLGIAYAVSSDEVTANAPDEKIKAISIGYNLGGMGITASYQDGTDVGFSSGADQKGIFVRTTTKF
jgi:hypothetical protein